MKRIALLLTLMLCLAWPAPAAPPADDPFGVVYVPASGDANLAADMAAIKAAGISWVRIRPDWTLLQPEKGKFDWTASDAQVRAARDAGLSIVFTFGYTPRWASPYADSEEVDVWNRSVPRDMKDWDAYVSAVVRRYTKHVTQWQVWERTSVHFFRGSDRDMRDMLRVATQAVHAVDPRQDVVLPEEGRLDLGAINAYYVWNTDPFYDVLALQPFFDRPEQSLRPLRTLKADIVDRKGPRKALWFSAMGWNAQALPGPLHDPVADEAAQARYLARTVVLGLSNGVSRVFWNAWRDRLDGPYQETRTSGLLRADGTPRPALDAYRHLISILSGRRWVSTAAWGPGLHGDLFAGAGGSRALPASDERARPDGLGGDGDEAVLVAWSEGDEARLDVSGVREVTDVLGKALATDRLTLTADPIYAVGPRDALERLMQGHPEPRQAAAPDFSTGDTVGVTFERTPVEEGLHAAKYDSVGSQRVRVVERGGRAGWETRLSDGRYDIPMDVDDTFLYFVDGRWTVRVDVEVHGNTSSLPVGFNVGYDSMKGYRFTPWQWVDAGDDWKRYSFTIRDADFSDPYADLRVNALGSKADLVVRSVTLKRAKVE